MTNEVYDQMRVVDSWLAMTLFLALWFVDVSLCTFALFFHLSTILLDRHGIIPVQLFD